VGHRIGPKRVDGVVAGDGSTPATPLTDPLGQGWGRGTYNETTGQWERYEYPPGHPNLVGDDERISWAQIILGQWPALVFDFQRLLHVNLPDVWCSGTWAWFEACTDGLLASAESMLRDRLVKAREG
jgi:hypothetical protein